MRNTADYGEKKEKKARRLPRRFAALALCLAVMLASFAGVMFFAPASAEEAGAVTNGASREADPSTMDTYLEMLDLLKNTRYAGRLWTDKSVFAFGKYMRVLTGKNGERIFDGKNLILSKELDGLASGGVIPLGSDFLEVFSALGSSLAVNEFPNSPLDLVIVIDMSASMAQDTRYGIDSNQPKYSGHTPSPDDTTKWPGSGVLMKDRIANSRIQKTLEAVNGTIDALMAQNRNNRVAVVGYGAGAAVLLPLAHYGRIDGNPYLSVGGMETLWYPADLKATQKSEDEYVWNWVNNRDACYTVESHALYSTSNDVGYAFDSNGNNGDAVSTLDNADESGIFKKTVSNNVGNEKVRALPGVQAQTDEKLKDSAKDIHNKNVFVAGFEERRDTITDTELKNAVSGTQELYANQYIGYYTNTQGGIYLGLSQLAETKETTFSDTLTGVKQSVTVPRIPAAIVMSDGGANFAFNEMRDWDKYYGVNFKDEDKYQKGISDQDFAKENWLTDGNGNLDEVDYSHRLPGAGDEWYKVYLPENVTSLYNDGMQDGTGRLTSPPRHEYTGVFYSSNDSPFGTSGTVLELLMTASYMTAAVNGHYTAGWDESKIEEDRRLDLQTYTVSVDAEHVPQWGRMRLYPSLDPAHCSLETGGWWNDNDKFGNAALGDVYTLDDVYTAMLQAWGNWRSGQKVEATIDRSNVKLSPLAADGYPDENFDVTVTNEDVIKNIVYSRGFYDVESGQLGDIFDHIFSLITHPIFTPVTGENDLAVEDSVTFMDPMGKYMEVKDVTRLLLFGELYNIARTAVYSYEFNEARIQSVQESNIDGLLLEGWYKGDDPETAEYGGNGAAPKDGTAWSGGWVYRVNAETAATYVPALARIRDEVTAEDKAVMKMRHTEYTFFRVVTENPDDFGKLRLNPAYGADGTGDNVLDTDPGAYRLSDLRVWVEDTGDYTDGVVDGGGLQSDVSFNQALWIDVPRYMLPLRTVTLTQSQNGSWTYESNMTADSPAYAASFPLRVFYEVGVREDMLTADRTVNTALVSREYIAGNKVMTGTAAEARGLEIGDLEFFSNWYNPENRYAEYVTTSVEYSYGDPASSFSPSGDNRYYVFQGALPLYFNAYQYKGGVWEKVDTKAAEFDPGGFGGKIIAIDLDCTADQISEQLPQGVTPAEGDIVLLKGDRISDVTVGDSDPFPSDGYYFLPIDFYELTQGEDKTATPIRFCVARRGSEFGSAYRAEGIGNGEMLCWVDLSGNNSQTYPYLSYTETGDETRGKDYIGKTDIFDDDGTLKSPDDCDNDPAYSEDGTWVLAAKKGGLRVGSLASAVGIKDKEYYTPDGAEVPSGGGDYQSYPNYKNERFPDKPETFTVGYLAGNVTRTANTYYLPTVSSATDLENDIIVIDTYLGNNGRLVVSDTEILLTKTLVPPLEGMPIDTDKEYDFTVTVKGRAGEYDAAVVKYENGKWARQIHYIDLLLDSKLFLLSTDGNKAMVDIAGKQVIQTGVDGGVPKYAYADNPEQTYDGTIYYVFIGSNAGSTDTGASDTVMRVYHNTEVHESDPDGGAYGPVDESDIIALDNEDGSRAFSAAKVWLFTEEQYNNFAEVDGRLEDEDGSPVGGDENYGVLNNFSLLTLGTEEPADEYSSADVAVTTPYNTETVYWTETVTFTDGEASVRLKSGYGLLFTGIPAGGTYTFAEVPDKADAANGYRFLTGTHSAGENQQTAIGEDLTATGTTAVGYEQSAHYTNTYDTDALEVAKTLVSGSPDDYPLTDKDKGVEFTYTVHFDWPETPFGDEYSPALYFWHGATDTANDGAPAPTEYEKIKELEVLAADLDGNYTFKLKGGETAVIYGLPAGTVYTVTETRAEGYPVQGGGDDAYTLSGTIKLSGDGNAAGVTSVVNEAFFTNEKPVPDTGVLSVEKNVLDDDPEDKTFTFKLSLTVPSDDELNYAFTPNLLTVERSTGDGEAVPDETVTWTLKEDSDPRVYTAEVELKHGEKITVKGVPYVSRYTVTETQRDGYNLQSVEDVSGAEPVQLEIQRDENGVGSVSGEIDPEKSPAAELRFNNSRAAFLPMTGGAGAGGFIAIGAGLLIIAGVLAAVTIRRRRKM